MIDLRGKPIVITGASSGIGRATAIACARAGMPVAVGARRVERLQALVEEIKAMGVGGVRGEGSGQAIAVACDVDSPAQCVELLTQATAAFGPVYAVFANAGYGVERALHEMSDAELRAIFETNVWGTLNIVRPAVEEMLRGAATSSAATPASRSDRGGEVHRGHVIVCASCLSKISLPYGGAYAATKACQDHFARAMRLELEDKGIHVSSVHPIGTRTEFFAQVDVRTGQPTMSNNTPDRWLQPPEKVADAIVRCLRRPRGEVWTSRSVRLLFALANAFPGFGDWAIRRYVRSRRRMAGRVDGRGL